MQSTGDDGAESDGSTSSSDDTIVEAVIALAPYLRSHYAKVPRNTSIRQGLIYLRELLESDSDSRFYDMARMQRRTFLLLLRVLDNTGLVTTTDDVCSGEKLMIFLRVLSRTTSRSNGEQWQHSGSTVSDAVHQVLSALLKVKDTYIQPPATDTSHHIASSGKFYPYFRNCIGAIDGTHIPAIVPSDDAPPFRNRKGFLSQNVLAACDFDMNFCYILAGWEGSAHDGRVLLDAFDRGFPRVEGKYFLGDAEYSLTTDTLTPYRGVRYHLKEWESGNLKSQTMQELFNLRHSSLRNVIERTFGVAKKKFPLLASMLPYQFDTQVKLVLGAAVVHNFIRSVREPLGYLDRPDPIRVADDSDIRDEDIINETETINAIRFRDEIAQQMWTDYKVYLAGRDNSVVL